MNKSINFKIYPSLLDKYQKFLDSEIEVEDFNNIDEEGNYKKSLQEIAAANEQSLIDAINRVPFQSEAADKGTAFNEIIDGIIRLYQTKEPTEMIDLSKIESHNKNVTIDTTDTKSIKATINGMAFEYDTEFCADYAAKFMNAMSQVYTEATIDTKYGAVLLYGYIDEWDKDKIIDIKTTSSKYAFPKFEHSWQKSLYPYCIMQNGGAVTSFIYSVVVWSSQTKARPYLTGTVYPEEYTYNHEEEAEKLRSFIEGFIDWLNIHKADITDKKIFALDNEPEQKEIEVGTATPFLISPEFGCLPQCFENIESIDDAFSQLAKIGIFAINESAEAKRSMTADEIKANRETMTNLIETERIAAVKMVADVAAFETSMKAEIKRRKEEAEKVLGEIDSQIMELAETNKTNEKRVHLAANETVRVSVSNMNLYYHFNDKTRTLDLACIMHATNDDKSSLFYQSEMNGAAMKKAFDIADIIPESTQRIVQLTPSNLTEFVGCTMVVDPARNITEDFVDEDTGKIVSLNRTVKYGRQVYPVELTAEILEDLWLHGFSTIIIK